MIKNDATKGKPTFSVKDSEDYKVIPTDSAPGIDKGMWNTKPSNIVTPGKDKNAPGVNKGMFSSIDKSLYC